MSSNILVSLDQICQVEGVSFSGDRSIFTITRGRDIILTASAYARNLWALDVDVLVPNMAASVTVSPKEIEIDFARGMCTPCVECRQHKTPFPTSQTIIDRPLQLIHTDIQGPMPVESAGGARYMLTVIDEYTDYHWSWPIKAKSETASTLAWHQTRNDDRGHARTKRKGRTGEPDDRRKVDRPAARVWSASGVLGKSAQLRNIHSGQNDPEDDGKVSV